MFTFESNQTVYEGILQPALALLSDEHPKANPQADQPARYWTISQSREDLADVENSPSVSMWNYLLASAQTQLLNQISIYVQRGTTSNQTRLLYMNDVALELWKRMGKNIKVTGRGHRPPRAAILSFGMPFSE